MGKKAKKEFAYPSPAILTELFAIILLIKEPTLSPSTPPKDKLDVPVPSMFGGKGQGKGS